MEFLYVVFWKITELLRDIYFSFSFFTSFLIDFTGVTLIHKTIRFQVCSPTKHPLHAALCAHQLLVCEVLGDKSYPVYFGLFLFFKLFSSISKIMSDR